jgi:hypothetical protein
MVNDHLVIHSWIIGNGNVAETRGSSLDIYWEAMEKCRTGHSICRLTCLLLVMPHGMLLLTPPII